MKATRLCAVLLLTSISGCGTDTNVEALSATSPPKVKLEPGTIQVHLAYKANREGILILQVDGTEHDRLRAEPSDDQGTPVTLAARGLSSGQHRFQVILELSGTEPSVRTKGTVLVP
jgi:hypothetical protein